MGRLSHDAPIPQLPGRHDAPAHETHVRPVALHRPPAAGDGEAVPAPHADDAARAARGRSQAGNANDAEARVPRGMHLGESKRFTSPRDAVF